MSSQVRRHEAKNSETTTGLPFKLKSHFARISRIFTRTHTEAAY